jgi:uncharacterized protein YlbG (UPF0298 family)
MVTGWSNRFSNSDLKCNTPYRQAVGALLYLALSTRPDILFAVTNLARYVNNFTEFHWTSVKRIFHYLQGSKNYAICYTKTKQTEVFGYSDSDWGGNEQDRKSISAFAFKMCNGPIMWASKSQNFVSLSSTEAELTAISEACKQIQYIKKILSALSLNKQTLDLYTDNQSAITIATQSVNSYNAKLKHTDIKIKYLRDLIASHKVNLLYCPTENNASDILTKPLPLTKFANDRSLLGLCEVSLEGPC